MKRLCILLFCLYWIGNIQAQNPYSSIGKEAKTLTLSNGKYNEFFANDTLVEIGSVVFNTITGKVVGFVEKDTMYSEYSLEPEVMSRWLSPDPLASEYTSYSPYNYVLNNPIIFIDPDGRKVKPSSEAEYNLIVKTLHPDDAKRLSLDDNGFVQISGSGGSAVGSENFAALQTIVGDDRTVEVSLTDDNYTFKDKEGNIKTETLRDKDGIFVYGVTLVPGGEKLKKTGIEGFEGSTNENFQVSINKKGAERGGGNANQEWLEGEIQLVMTVGHELYNHILSTFQMNKGKKVKKFADEKSFKENEIEKTETESEKNYKLHKN